MNKIENSEKKKMIRSQMGAGIAIGLMLGAGVGVAIQNIPVGMGVGLLLGVVFDVVNRNNFAK